MKPLSRFAAAIMLSLACSAAVASIQVTPLGPDLVATGNQTSQAEINLAIFPYLAGQTLVYLNNVGQADSGTLADSYTTLFFNTPTDPMNFEITYNGSGNIISDPSFLLVKDGNQDPSWYLFNISLWDAVSTLTGSNFWPEQGAISHVSVYGGSAPPPPDDDEPPVVPEPTALLVWGGLAACALGVVKINSIRRRA